MSCALVIGASRGLGLEFTRQLTARGDFVLATARSPEGLAAISELGAEAIPLDVRDDCGAESIAGATGGVSLDLVILNAGVFGSQDGPNRAPDRDLFDEVMGTNLYGPMRLIPSLAPIVEDCRGRIVVISSDMASLANTQSSHGIVYRASKAGLNMLVRSAAAEFPKITFLAMSPGWVRTDMGGPEASLSPAESVSGMLNAIETLGPSDSGAFRNYRNEVIPW